VKSQNPKKEGFSFEDKKFNICFNIGSNWGPRLLVRRGEHVDLVPLLGKWSQLLLSVELV